MGKGKILIVDDNADTRLILGARLRSSDYDTAFAGDAYQAVTAARNEKPHAIILDIGLPGGNGFIVLQRLKSITTLASIPVIVISSEARHAVEARVLEAGAVEFLEKPVDQDRLLVAVRKVLGEPAEPVEQNP
jgi:DNA-binding response OmpR family regulator